MANSESARSGSYNLKAGDRIELNVVKPSQIVLKIRDDGGITVEINDLPPEISN